MDHNFDALKHILFVGTFFAAVFLDLLLVRFARPLHTTAAEDAPRSWRAVSAAVLILLILISCWAMSLNPLWNGEIPEQRDQYERLAESFLNGHLYLDYGEIDPGLLSMENPYDPAAREALGVDFKWDHAFFNGHYYMYFGVVPVILLFLPFRFLTGLSLTGYHATQIFTAAFFCGVFAVFRFLSRRFSRGISCAAWLMMAVTVCFTSVANCIACPALYNTAVSSALCMEIWSLFFFLKAVWGDEAGTGNFAYAAAGSVFGALSFGCRPNIALANVAVLPLLFLLLRKKREAGPFTRKNLLKLLAVLLPYVITAALLMWYNHARFENPFEFGQSYQLTVADQSHYSFGSVLQLHWVTAVNALLYNFFQTPVLTYRFPFVSEGCLFLAYPLYAYILLGAADRHVRSEVHANRLTGFLVCLLLSMLLITIVNVLWAPFLTARYREDFIWLAGILCFLLAGFRFHDTEGRLSCSRWICRWSILTLAVTFLLTADQIMTF